VLRSSFLKEKGSFFASFLHMSTTKNMPSEKELFLVFFKLGSLGFGGPAAHIAMMREEVVLKREWISEGDFFDLVGATGLIPGPNSTELAIHVGHRLLGWRGLFIAGLSFIVPAFLAVLSLAWFYVKYGSIPVLNPILEGIRPVIISIILIALWNFRKSAVRNWKETIVSVLAIMAGILGYNEVAIILISGLLLILAHKIPTKKYAIEPISIFLFFLKIGSVLFGSGYVLLAFLQNELVDERLWLTSSQLMDAVTVGQITPGPVFTTATFIGYLLNGFSGATLATIGIFLPSFFFVAISAPYLARLRNSEVFSQLLNGINAASFALMALVSFELGSKSLMSFPTWGIFIISLVTLHFTKINSAYLIILGGILGYLFL
jgi:chromate transporter